MRTHIHQPRKYRRRQKHHDAVDHRGYRHRSIADHIKGNVNSQSPIMNPNFHSDGNGLFLGNFEK